MVSRIAMALAALGLAGCATQAKFEAKLNTFVGSMEGDLVHQWGAPDSVYPMADGTKILTYRRAGQAFIPGYQTATTTVYGNTAYTQVNGSPGMMIAQHCKIDWTVDSHGLISSWRWEGNACKSR